MKIKIKEKINSFLFKEKQNWKLASENYFALSNIRNKIFEIDNNEIIVQFNPERIISSSAAVDKKSISKRKCFLCEENRPQEQSILNINSAYDLLLNPFPIFNPHFTIPANTHKPQLIKNELEHFVSLLKFFEEEYTVFYNGPECGASAPDHMHFQACPKSILPIEAEYRNFAKEANLIFTKENLKVFSVNDKLRQYFVLEFTNQNSIQFVNEIYSALEKTDQFEYEPKLNLMGFRKEDRFTVLIFPRTKHRPDFYFAENETQILISPASVDMGGIVICPREKDFNKIDETIIRELFGQVCYSEDEIKRVLNFLDLN
ncbi:MAG: DUF4922 domain-containing protein [Rhodothermaceae bacterium]